MNIRKLSYGMIGLSMLAGTIASCYDTKYEDKAKAQAVKYLSGDELLKAERFARVQIPFQLIYEFYIAVIRIKSCFHNNLINSLLFSVRR